MKKTIGLNEFRDAFYRMNRKDNFSYEGLEALFDYLEQYENDTGQEMELDVIGLCCDFTEYEDLEDLQKEHDIETIEDFEAIVIEFDGGIIIQNY